MADNQLPVEEDGALKRYIDTSLYQLSGGISKAADKVEQWLTDLPAEYKSSLNEHSASSSQMMNEGVKAISQGRIAEGVGKVGLGGFSAVLAPISAGVTELVEKPGNKVAPELGSKLSTVVPIPAPGGKFAGKSIRPAKENLSTVVKSNFNHAKIIGDEIVPIETLKGGTSNSVDEIKRVNKLAEDMKGKDGYIERLIVDDEGKVIEGQHRLDALRKNGTTEVPITRIKDLERGYDVDAAKKAIKDAGIQHSDQVRGVMNGVLDVLHETKGDFKAAREYEIPGYDKQFQAALNALEQAKNFKKTPVDHDPFKQKASLKPVDHDPEF